MTRSILCLTVIGSLAVGCSTEPEPVDRVQTNLVDKAIFEGEWWHASTSIDVNFDEAYVFSSADALAPYTGAMSTDFGLDYNRGGTSVLGEPRYSFPMARIRWVIDENYLFAFRSHELVSGGNDDGRSPDFTGQPLAVFTIEAHVDVRQDYNSVTGEETNVRVENTGDRRWYERKFIRVDWSQNLLTQFSANELSQNELFHGFSRESTPFFVQEGQGTYPESYEPQFVRVRDDEDYRFVDEWPEDERDTVHYMSFVTREVWSPGGSCLLQGGGICASITATLRNSFLRVPPNHEYASQTSTNSEFERFGIYRSHQPTYARGGQDKSVLRIHCDDHIDCGPGGACDMDEHICTGGLTEDRGRTDFLTFYTSRQNFYADSLTDQQCVSDWECDGRYDSDASRDQQGSVCDGAARRCTVPLRDRPLRPIQYVLTPHFPPHLVRGAFEAVAEWNEALMRGQRAATGKLPIDQVRCSPADDEEDGIEDGACTTDLAREARVECQDDDPTDFCFCGSPEEVRDRCVLRYSPFESPESALARGIPNPYDCYVDGPRDLRDPSKYTDYEPADAYSYEFKGDECMLTLRVNSCDVDDETACEELGDLRFQFINHIQHGAVAFDGVSTPLSDPISGEILVANAAVAAEGMERMATLSSQFFPVLRGDVPEDEYFSGEHLRGYFARLGRVKHPVALVDQVGDGYGVDDNTRPESQGVDAYKDLAARLESLSDQMQLLQGNEGRAAILEDRVLSLRGTEIESRLSAAFASEVASGSGQSQEYDPFKGPLEDALLERRRHQAMASRNLDKVQNVFFNGQYWRYWSNAFDRVDVAQASIRMQQLFFRSVLKHELGHAMGLRHNLAASLDRDQYHDGYFNIARSTPLPAYVEYDAEALGGNNDGATTGEEAQRFAEALRVARAERLVAGAGNVMTSSIMDQPGDTSFFAGVGRYDRAAVLFSYFGKVEAYQSLPCGDDDGWCTGDRTSPEDYPGGLSATADNAPSLSGLYYSDAHRREMWTYYRGGGACNEHSDCPNAAGSETTIFQPITQRCVTNPRDLGPRLHCDGLEDNCVCTNFFDDFDDYLNARAYRTSTREPEYFPVEYMYCHDNRADDLSWCTARDAGETFQEVVAHYRSSWLEAYPQVYYRNYRREGPDRGYSDQTVVDAVKIFQHLFFRYNFEGAAFRNSTGPLGLQDQLVASSDVLDWLGEIIGTPDVGAYEYDAAANVYRKFSDDPLADGADLRLEPGQGFHLWSQYQEGLNGYNRLERAGTFLDKFLAIQAIARRDWGLSFTVDERYYINFYNLFEQEVIDMFGGLILRNPRAYAPRVQFDADGNPVIQYLSTYRVSGRGNQDETYPAAAIDGTDSEVLRDMAAIQALATFPIYYDTSFEQRLLVFKLGSGDGYKIPENHPDGTPTCVYSEFVLGNCARPDYITYDSDRLHTTYVAVVIDPNLDGDLDEQQLGYQLLKKLTDVQLRVRALTALEGLTPAEAEELIDLRLELERDESFVEYLIELARSFGITSYL